ncbi:Uncharacterized protein APZ42_015730 [Daphnia magna]|uniref:Uncharacterized protein n=1 Tax=Daphnia magna TaxID=35525 RepID=A0A162NPS4_9CRUS|nr:Uncharacterized protein APZ42_015730 [Daphnia magna]
MVVGQFLSVFAYFVLFTIVNTFSGPSIVKQLHHSAKEEHPGGQAEEEADPQRLSAGTILFPAYERSGTYISRDYKPDNDQTHRPTESNRRHASSFSSCSAYLELSTPELLPQIQASKRVAKFILILPSVSVSPPSNSRNFRPPVQPIPQPQAVDPTPHRLRLDYFHSAAGRDIDTYIKPPQPPEALRVDSVESAQSRLKNGPRQADFISPPSPKKPLFYRSYSTRPVEHLSDPPTPPGVPESEPEEFIPNIADCEVRSEVGKLEETPASAEPEQPARSWRIQNTRTQIPPQPEATAVNAFSLNWSDRAGYAFPPFALIPKCLEKLRREKPYLVMICPVWPAQPCFPVLLELTCDVPILLHASQDLLVSKNWSWDPSVVIQFMAQLGKNKFIPFPSLTRKTATLLALASLLRVSELAAINFQSINFSERSVKFSLLKPRMAQHSGPWQTISIPLRISFVISNLILITLRRRSAFLNLRSVEEADERFEALLQLKSTTYLARV